MLRKLVCNVCTALLAAAATAAEARRPMALMVFFDGGRADCLRNADCPNLKSLINGRWMPAEIRNLVETKGAKGNKRFNGTVQKGPTLVLAAEGVKAPKKLRYLFQRPWFGCVYNEVDLPLGAFELKAK